MKLTNSDGSNGDGFPSFTLIPVDLEAIRDPQGIADNIIFETVVTSASSNRDQRSDKIDLTVTAIPEP